MLETTLSTTFVPGTNLKGQVAGANWSFLLPDLNLKRVVCLGSPSPATLTTLSFLSQEVIIVCANSRPTSEMTNSTKDSGLDNVRPIAVNGNRALPFPNESIDLILIAGWHGAQQLNRDQAMVAQLQRLLKPEGYLYFEFGGFVDRWLGGISKGFGTPCIFWLTPTRGEMHTAVPLHDGETINYFLHRRLYSPSIKLRLFDQIEQFLNKHLLSNRLTQRYGALVTRKDAAAIDQPPQYLRSIAQQAGVSLDRYRWGLSAPGDYSSRKLLFFLFDRASGPDTPPKYIVKMVRDPAFNTRLENEYQALCLLRDKGIGNRETLPQAVFCGHHNNLAIVGETAVNGVPFRQRTKATADCPYGRSAIDWLIDLGAATADPTAVTPAQVAEGLMKLFTQFVEIYRLTSEQYTFLNDQIVTIGQSQEGFPLVFQHGDPGTWNVIATSTEQAAFLDWEAAEPQGMPLWDLFYFMRSYAVWAARLGGVRNSLRGFRQRFLADSELSQFLVQATHQYCQRSGLPRRLVEPLFYTCWMHRALKEANRLTPAKLENGHYVSLLRLCIEQRQTPTLRRLLS